VLNHNFINNSYNLIFLCLISFISAGCSSLGPDNLNNSPSKGYIYSTDGNPIYYIRNGQNHKNATLLFIHCWGCNRGYWSQQIDYFSKKYQSVALDLIGHGLSGSERNKFTIEHYAKDIDSAIKQLNLQNVILIGQSFGGAIAVETAVQFSDKIKGIISINAFGEAAPISDKKEIKNFLKPFQENYYQKSFKFTKSRFAAYTDKSIIYKISKDIALAPSDIALDSLKNYLFWITDKYNNAVKKLTVPLIQIQSIKFNHNQTHNSNKIIFVESSGYYLPQEAPGKLNLALEKAINKIITE